MVNECVQCVCVWGGGSEVSGLLYVTGGMRKNMREKFPFFLWDELGWYCMAWFVHKGGEPKKVEPNNKLLSYFLPGYPVCSIMYSKVSI